MPFCCACFVVVVTSVGTSGSAARDAAMRESMSDQAQVRGGSSQMYEKRRSNQPLALKCFAQPPTTGVVEGPLTCTAVSFAPCRRVLAVPSKKGPTYWSK